MKNIFTKIFTGIVIAALAGVSLYVALVKQNALDSQLTANQNQVRLDQGPGLPRRLVIPSINVDAPVIYVGLASDGTVDVPKGPQETAWFQLGPRPGQQGSAVITGHFGPWRNGGASVFDNLDKLKVGDIIYVKDNENNQLSFKVQESRIYQSDESPKEVFNNNDGIYLNLITCNGEWLANQKTYTQRLVVFTEAV